MSDLGAVERLAESVPESVAGYRSVRSVIDCDGALSAAEKALLVAASAAVRGYAGVCARELTRGRGLGLRDDQIATAAAALLLSRGEGASGLLLEAAGEISPQGPPAPRCEVEAEEYLLGYNQVDELPARFAVLAEHAPPVFEGYFRMHHAALRSRPEAAKLAELVVCAANAADIKGDFVAAHAVGARRAGATDRELLEAIVCAMPVGGVGAWAASVSAIGLDVSRAGA
jgi:alkylhydroperoxidase/carboxymuconolactone decarboxylase family protein YurZ